MISNLTKKTLLVSNVKICKTLLSRTLGLMFKPKIRNRAFVFAFPKQRKISLHMLFVFQTIDVILLDDNYRVIEIKQDFKPFAFFNSKKRANIVLELPEATIRKSNTKTGDFLKIEVEKT